MCSSRDAPTKFQRPSSERTASSWMGNLLTRAWTATNANAIGPPCPQSFDGATRFTATGREAIRLIFGDEKRKHCIQRAILARRDLSQGEASPSVSLSNIVSGAALAVVCACPAIPSAARAALMFAAAANSVCKTMQGHVGWHHYIILEFVEASYAVHLVPEGMHVSGIDAGVQRSPAQVQDHRQELLMKRASTTCIHVAEELSVHTLDPCYPVATEATQIWLTSVVDDTYNLCTWNCQNFTQDLLGVIAPYCVNRGQVHHIHV